MSAMPPLHLAITGSTGFLGYRLLLTALEQGHQVTALVRHPHKLQAIATPNLRLMPWDLTQLSLSPALLEGVDAFCHFAAFKPPDQRDPESAAACFSSNAQGVLPLLEAAIAAGVPRFVFSGAGNAYQPQAGLAKETDPLYPALYAPFYLSSKVAGEVFVQHYHLTRQLPVTILRIASIYGPGMGDRGLIPTLIQRLGQGLPVTLQDGGRYSVDLVYVEDVVAATLTAITHQVDGIFNIGSGVATSVLTLAQTLADLLQISPDLLQVLPLETAHPPVQFAALDITQARQHLHFSPTPLVQGLSHSLVLQAPHP